MNVIYCAIQIRLVKDNRQDISVIFLNMFFFLVGVFVSVSRHSLYQFFKTKHFTDFSYYQRKKLLGIESPW